MKSYLLTWNPNRTPFDGLTQETNAIRHHGNTVINWSCGNNKSIAPGSQIYLLRQGVKPAGIIGFGYALCAPYSDGHWEPGKTKSAQYINVRLLSLVDPSRHGLLETGRLGGVLKTVNWTTRIAGIEIKEAAAAALAARWRRFLKTKGIPLGSWYSAEQYAAAIEKLGNKLTDIHRTLLIAHASAPDLFLTNRQLARLLGKKNQQIIYSQYGRLGGLIGKALGYRFEEKETRTRLIGDDRRAKSGGLAWTMEPSLARALFQLGWATASRDGYTQETTDADRAKSRGVNGTERTNVSQTTGQGREPDPEVRRAIETRAMAVARRFYEGRGYKVTDTSARKPYDFVVSKQMKELRVEVKGARGQCDAVTLTAGEINSAVAGPESTDLFVVSRIKVRVRDGKVVATGGIGRVFENWRPLRKDLVATEYRYRLSAVG